jgi:acyl-CoA hydrolase
MTGEKNATPISADAAARLVKSGDWLDYGFCLGQPDLFDQALAERRAELSSVKIRSCLSMRPRAVLETDPGGDHFLWFNWHFSGYDRKQHDLGRCNYIPMNFGEAPGYYRRFIDPIDVVCIKTTPIDDQGFFNFGCNTTYLQAMIEQARILIVETCSSMPRAIGPENRVHASHVDFVIDGGDAPLPTLAAGPVGDADRAVAAQIAAEIEDGSCLQIGIGAMPNAVCSLLRHANLRNLGIHTEMLVDGMADLIEAGIVTNSEKQIDRGRSVYSFAAGSAKLYKMIDGNQDLMACPVDHTNLPHNIALNDKVVSVNNSAEIDLQGQAASEAAGHRHISGTGGQLQFVRGAFSSRGGKSFLCLASTYEKHGVRKSRIVSSLTPGSIVTTPRTDVMYLVTEWGMANLKGKSVAERASALISLAHPDFREQLEREAYDLNLLPKGYRR